MKACDYCGRENENEAVICAGCGIGLTATTDLPRSAEKRSWLSFKRIVATIVFAFIGLLLLLVLPDLFLHDQAVRLAKLNGIISNLRMIESAKAEWAKQNGKSAWDEPLPEELFPFIKNHRMPSQVDGESYQINPGSIGPTAKLTKDLGKLKAGSIVTPQSTVR